MKGWKNLIFTFIFIAYSIILMHMVVPHQHYNAISDEFTIQPSGCYSLVGFLQIFFSADLGENHLEQFQKKQFTYLDLSFTAVLLYIIPTEILILKQNKATPAASVFIDKLRQKLFIKSSESLRAPPVLA